MRARDIRPGDLLVLLAVRVGSVFTDNDTTVVSYDEGYERNPEVFHADDDLVIYRKEDS